MASSCPRLLKTFRKHDEVMEVQFHRLFVSAIWMWKIGSQDNLQYISCIVNSIRFAAARCLVTSIAIFFSRSDLEYTHSYHVGCGACFVDCLALCPWVYYPAVVDTLLVQVQHLDCFASLCFVCSCEVALNTGMSETDTKANATQSKHKWNLWSDPGTILHASLPGKSSFIFLVRSFWD